MQLSVIALFNHVSVKTTTWGLYVINKNSKSVALFTMLRAFSERILSYERAVPDDFMPLASVNSGTLELR